MLIVIVVYLLINILLMIVFCVERILKKIIFLVNKWERKSFDVIFLL